MKRVLVFSVVFIFILWIKGLFEFKWDICYLVLVSGFM